MIYTINEKRNVLEASKDRIIQVFKTAPRVVLNTSGGKDSIVLGDIVYKLCVQGIVDKSKLEVWFVDEEAMYDEVIQIVKAQRLKWLSIGVSFKWYCFQNRHYNCLNSLKEDESFICWDKEIPDKWVRERPKFSITEDECLDDRHENYQSWANKKIVQVGGVNLCGIRCNESLQRFATMSFKKKIGSTNSRVIWPIYDWTDNDIWYYIKENHLDFPKTYVELWQVGVPKNKLRISQFFALDTVQSLSRLVYIKPDLYDKIVKREPNAYLLLLYSGTDMFGGKDSKMFADKQKKMLKNDAIDYKKESIDILFYNNPKNKSVVYDKKLWKYMKKNLILNKKIKDSNWKDIYYILVLGDHKRRKYRAAIYNFEEK